MSLRQDGAHASLTVPNRSAQQMAFDASPRTEATRRELMLRARDATDSTDSPVAMRPLDARATCCGRTSDVLHEAYGTGTALGGAMGDASTAGDSATGGAKAAASRATEDMHTLIRALKTDLSCMSVRLERLEALLSA